MIDPTLAIHGLAERWVARERVAGERLEVATRSCQAVVAGKLNLALVKATGEIGWRRVLGGKISIGGVAIEPFGGLVAALVEGPRIELMRGAQGEPCGSIKLPESCVSVALSERGERVVVGDRFGTIRYFDASGRTKDTAEVGHPVELIAIAPSGEQVVAASYSGHVTLLNAKHKPERTSYVRAQVERERLDARGERAFALATGEGVLVHSLRTSSMVTIGLDRPVVDADSNMLGDLVVVLAYDMSVAVLDAAARLVWQGDAPPGTIRVRANFDLSRLWFHDREGVLTSFDVLRGAEGARRAASLARGPRKASVHQIDIRPLPAPGGFARVYLDPDPGSARLALVHPSGLVVVLAQRGRELERLEIAGGPREVLFTQRGGLLGVSSAKGVALLDPAQGWRATAALDAPVLGTIHGAAALLAASAQGEISLLAADGARPFAHLDGPASAVVGARTAHGIFAFVALTTGELVALGPLGDELFRIGAGVGEAPLRLAAIGDRVLLGNHSGRLKLVSLRGSVLGEAKTGLPVVSVETVGDGFVVVDSRGEIHRWTHTLDRGEGRQPPPGVFRAVAGPEGPACLVQHDRDSLVIQSWGRRELQRFEVGAGLVDLAGVSHDRWAILTGDALITPKALPPARG